MNLKKYFEETRGTGVLATSDADGKVDVAVYARPHFMDDNTVAFIMAERLTHENLKANPWAAYLFIEADKGYVGKRLYLKKIREEQNEQLVAEICRRCNYPENTTKFIVYFTIEKILPLIGTEEVIDQR